MDITKMVDNFEGTDIELKNIAKTVFECVDGSNEDDFSFMDECESMLLCDYDFLNDNQFEDVRRLIEELICNEGNFKDEEKFFIFNYNCSVSVVGRFEDEGNLDMFGLTCENQDYADILAEELEPLVRFMNEQDKLINNK